MDSTETCEATKPPFPVELQSCAELDAHAPSRYHMAHMPGYPCLSLQDKFVVRAFLEHDLRSKDLESIADRLWWMSKQDSANISPLHRQRVKRRNIVISEDPKLHLVWAQDRIFVKPLPRYLLSYAFWRDWLGVDSDDAARARAHDIRKAALGYLRTYFYLIRSEHDFRIAQDEQLRLVPSGISWEQFCCFISCLAKVSDREVSGRYRYGEIRLTRLNFYAPWLLGRANFQRVEYQYSQYFARFFAPILFLIGITSIVLNGFQIIVSVEQASPTRNSEAFYSVALWFGVSMILLFCILFSYLALLLVYKVIKEWRYAIYDRLRLMEGAS